MDCSGAANAVDALKILRFVAALSVHQADGCPPINSGGTSLWGDVDCSSDIVDAVDALKILRYVVALPVQQTGQCTPIGSMMFGWY